MFFLCAALLLCGVVFLLFHARHSRKAGDFTKRPRGMQIGPSQVAAIRRSIPPQGNLLVWGLGNDSPFWNDITSGRVAFLEPGVSVANNGVDEQSGANSWFGQIMAKYPWLEAHKVVYTTKISRDFEQYVTHGTEDKWREELDIRLQLPNSVLEERWDVILVDSPAGWQENQPGRFQSIYTSALLASKGTHIFVDDFERDVERSMSKRIFGTPLETTHRDGGDGWFGGGWRKNAQGHFVVT